MAQISIGTTIAENLKKTLQYMERAKAAEADLIFFWTGVVKIEESEMS